VVVAESVATITVDNPPVNALTNAVLEHLREALATIAASEDVRAVVLTGAGTRAFAAGADLRQLERHAGDRAFIAARTALTRETFERLETLPQPVIAAAQASAVGGGLEAALACDLVVADPRSAFGLPEVTLGLIPGAGGTVRLPRRIGLARARTLMLTGELVAADRALELGLVDLVSAPGEALTAAHGMAARLASFPALAVRALKRTLAPTSDTAPFDRERALLLELFGTADFREGARAFLEKREPRFTGGHPS